MAAAAVLGHLPRPLLISTLQQVTAMSPIAVVLGKHADALDNALRNVLCCVLTCSLVLMVSNGCPTMMRATPPLTPGRMSSTRLCTGGVCSTCNKGQHSLTLTTAAFSRCCFCYAFTGVLCWLSWAVPTEGVRVLGRINCCQAPWCVVSCKYN
jgi:hypothetical protein